MNGGLLIIRGLQDNSVKNVDPVSLCGPGIGQVPSQILDGVAEAAEKFGHPPTLTELQTILPAVIPPSGLEVMRNLSLP
jgi:hypothetical protein